MPEATSTTGLKDIDSVRARTVDMLDRLTAAAAEFGLPKPPDAFETYRRKLAENRYTVLVAGEAKRGKSTFVNAVIGRNLLPTDVDIATCQVFRIQQALGEGCRVRFEDDSAVEITAADLPRFGSQVQADSDEAPRLNQIIRWIEVEGPIQFLPKEITLLDTPGLGSVYAAHGRITQRFVPLADAVIFVLSSDSPIGREEVQFLEHILSVTRSVFFIQTMIDRYKREHWQAIQTRDQQVLAEKFGDRLPDNQVWAISSANLLKAAQTGDMDYEQVSRFRPLAAALRAFLFRVAGWSRAAEALVLALEYQRFAAQVLAQRRTALQEASAAERAARQQGMADRRRVFEEQWGPQGQQRKALLEAVHRVAQLDKQGFRQILGPGGAVQDHYLQQIASLKTTDEAQALARRASDEIIQDVSVRWREICGKAQDQCVQLLVPFLTAAETGIVVPHEPNRASPLTTADKPRLEADAYAKIQLALREGGFAGGMTIVGANIATAIFPVLLGLSLFPPVAVIAVLGASLFGIVRGARLASGRQLQEARRELEQHVRAVLQRVQQHYFNVDPDSGRFALVEEFFDGLVGTIAAHVEKVGQEKLGEAQAELARLVDEARLDERGRKEKAEQLSAQISTWTELGAAVRALVTQLDQLECLYQSATPVSAAIP